uniref:DNA polymerase II subunit 2 n=1 Tax=Oryza barthii TaxID=65489 RepID=A0A0D3H169_9ORYZ
MATPSAAARKKLQRKFRLRGFTLKVDALEEAAAFLARFPDAEDDALDLLLDELDKEPRGGGGRCGVSGGHQRALGAAGGGFVRRATVPLRSNQESIPADYSSMEKLEIKQPYTGIGIRLARDKYFSKPAFDTVMTEDDNCEITSIQSLIGCTGRRWIMGVISQLEERQFYLEDLTGAVNTCGFPPLEDREASLSMLMGLDFFGGGVIAAEETVRLSTLEKKAMNDMFVILSDVWLDSSEKHIPNAIFVSNPCRVKFYTQEIVFFQQDLLYRMRRSCLIPPTTEETSDPFEHLVATIIHQSHLCPLPLTVQPIIWNYDHCLRLYPTPHTIVLGDKSE